VNKKKEDIRPKNGKKKNPLWRIFDSKGYWIAMITVASFFLSGGLSLLSGNILEKATFIIDFGIIIAIIVVNIVFDIIGIATTAADSTPFHAMASNKIYGAKMAIQLVKHAEKVSSFCNDIVGDICGVISGVAGAYLIIKLMGENIESQSTLLGITITGLIASLTVGGKALGKAIALSKSNYIVYKVAVVVNFILKGFDKNKDIIHKSKV